MPMSKSLSSSPDRVPFEVWLRKFGRTRATGHRWRRAFPDVLDVVNIMGRLYVTVESALKFEDLAQRGRLAVHRQPPPGLGRPKKTLRTKKKLESKLGAAVR